MIQKIIKINEINKYLKNINEIFKVIVYLGENIVLLNG